MCEHYSGMTSPFEVATKFDEVVAWGTPANPDVESYDPLAPATEAEKRAGAGLLALTKDA